MLRGADQWLLPYVTRKRHRVHISLEQPLHAFIAVCDHFEPLHDTDLNGAKKALADWQNAWPQIVDDHRDSSGRGPRHTFFYPIEQYHPEIIDPLAKLCAQTGSEVEVHLHHDGDTEATLIEMLEQGKANLAKHGLLSRDAEGRPQYGFIHGNWALDNSHPTGRKCGVSNELAVLKRTGCYADLTMPAAPDPCQTKMLNSVYYAREDGRPKSHDRGTLVQQGKTAGLRDLDDQLLLVQGPLGLNWRWRTKGVLPRVENGDLTERNPPTLQRLRLWLQLCPRVENAPAWVFIKLHTHGGIPRNYNMLLGDPARRFYRDLASFARQTPGFHYHFVTAREMVNLVHAAEDGHSGPPSNWFDHRYPRPPLA